MGGDLKWRSRANNSNNSLDSGEGEGRKEAKGGDLTSTEIMSVKNNPCF